MDCLNCPASLDHRYWTNIEKILKLFILIVSLSTIYRLIRLWSFIETHHQWVCYKSFLTKSIKPINHNLIRPVSGRITLLLYNELAMLKICCCRFGAHYNLWIKIMKTLEFQSYKGSRLTVSMGYFNNGSFETYRM